MASQIKGMGARRQGSSPVVVSGNAIERRHASCCNPRHAEHMQWVAQIFLMEMSGLSP